MIQSIITGVLCSIIYSSTALATSGIGEVAGTLYEPLTLIIQLVRSISIICGGALLIGAVLKFIEYRRNPMAVRLSTVFFMILFGIALILLGMIPMHFFDGSK